MKPNFKGRRITTKMARAKKAAVNRKAEREAKAIVRARDRVCRFPGGNHAWPLEVAHLQHKGMGGNPAGDRSVPEKMILLCRGHHQSGPVSLHRGTLKVEPLTDAGTNGEVRFHAWRPDLVVIPEMVRVVS